MCQRGARPPGIDEQERGSRAAGTATPGVWGLYIWPDDGGDAEAYTLTVEATDEGREIRQHRRSISPSSSVCADPLAGRADDSGIAGDNITNVKTPGFTLNNIALQVIKLGGNAHNGVSRSATGSNRRTVALCADSRDWADGDYIPTVKVKIGPEMKRSRR